MKFKREEMKLTIDQKEMEEYFQALNRQHEAFKKWWNEKNEVNEKAYFKAKETVRRIKLEGTYEN